MNSQARGQTSVFTTSLSHATCGSRILLLAHNMLGDANRCAGRYNNTLKFHLFTLDPSSMNWRIFQALLCFALQAPSLRGPYCRVVQPHQHITCRHFAQQACTPSNVLASGHITWTADRSATSWCYVSSRSFDIV